jgi:glyoxylase-like metal-dependent hydrolase (beta-lactamase superfamily II)
VKIVDNVYVVPEVRANAYLLIDPDGVTLIDAGLPWSQKKILDYLATLGKAPADLKRIILTHGDLDHVGSLAALHRATGARTYASKIEAEAIAAGKSPRPLNIRRPPWQRLLRLLMKQKPFQVDEILTDGQILPILGGLQVVDTAGHTPGHISLFAPAASILFCGDSMVTDENGIHGSRPPLTWNQEKAAEAARRQAALGARIVCSGHGPVIMDAAGKYPV